jgi:hypothetical protein
MLTYIKEVQKVVYIYKIHFVSDCDCPDCAPYCSTSGFCQQTQAEGSTACGGKECYTDDDCYLEPEGFAKVLGRHGCSFYEHQCDIDKHRCRYRNNLDLFSNFRECRLQNGAFGDDCPREVEWCEELNLHNDRVVIIQGFQFTSLKELAVTAGTSLQVQERSQLTAGQCNSVSCRTRTGNCCKPVWRSSRRICPYIC